jgi:hypothetical protein
MQFHDGLFVMGAVMLFLGLVIVLASVAATSGSLYGQAVGWTVAGFGFFETLVGITWTYCVRAAGR